MYFFNDNVGIITTHLYNDKVYESQYGLCMICFLKTQTSNSNIEMQKKQTKDKYYDKKAKEYVAEGLLFND